MFSAITKLWFHEISWLPFGDYHGGITLLQTASVFSGSCDLYKTRTFGWDMHAFKTTENWEGLWNGIRFLNDLQWNKTDAAFPKVCFTLLHKRCWRSWGLIWSVCPWFARAEVTLVTSLSCAMRSGIRLPAEDGRDVPNHPEIIRSWPAGHGWWRWWFEEPTKIGVVFTKASSKISALKKDFNGASLLFALVQTCLT